MEVIRDDWRAFFSCSLSLLLPLSLHPQRSFPCIENQRMKWEDTPNFSLLVLLLWTTIHTHTHIHLMSWKWFSTTKMPRNSPLTSNTTQMIFNTSYQTTIASVKSTRRRWINGMIMGSIPFLIILLCWMFVSLCVNNFVRIYYRKHRRRPETQSHELDEHPSKVNV